MNEKTLGDYLSSNFDGERKEINEMLFVCIDPDPIAVEFGEATRFSFTKKPSMEILCTHLEEYYTNYGLEVTELVQVNTSDKPVNINIPDIRIVGGIKIDEISIGLVVIKTKGEENTFDFMMVPKSRMLS